MEMFNVLVLILMLGVAFYAVTKSKSNGASVSNSTKESNSEMENSEPNLAFTEEMAELRKMIMGVTKNNNNLTKQVFKYVDKVEGLSKTIERQGEILAIQGEELVKQSNIISSQERKIAVLQRSNEIKEKVIIAADKLVVRG